MSWFNVYATVLGILFLLVVVEHLVYRWKQRRYAGNTRYHWE